MFIFAINYKPLKSSIMKSGLHYWVNLLVISILAFNFTGCSDDDNKNEIVPPTLALQAGESTITTISFTMIAENAEDMAYLLTKTDAAAPTFDQIFSEGTIKAATENQPVIIENLEVNAKYKVYAAARNGELKSEVVSLETQTGDYTNLVTLLEKGKNYFSYHLKTTAENTPVLHLGVEKNLLDFFLEDLTDEAEIEKTKQELLVAFGYHGTGEKTYTLKDGEIDPDDNAVLEVLAGIPYVILAVETDAEGNVTGQTSMVEFITEAPAISPYGITIEVNDITPETAHIICTPDQGITYFYQALFTKEAAEQYIAENGAEGFRAYILNSGDRCDEGTDDFIWKKLSPDTDYVMYLIGIDANGDQKEVNKGFHTAKKENPSGYNIIADRALKVLYYTGGNYYVEFGDCEMTLDATGNYYPTDGGAGNWVIIDCYGDESTDPENPVFSSGTYTFDPNNTYAFGTCSEEYTWANSWDADGNLTRINFSSGSITVTQNGTDYQINIQLITTENINFKCTYNGPLSFIAGQSPAILNKSATPSPAPHRFSRETQTDLNVQKYGQAHPSSLKDKLKNKLGKK